MKKCYSGVLSSCVPVSHVSVLFPIGEHENIIRKLDMVMASRYIKMNVGTRAAEPLSGGGRA